MGVLRLFDIQTKRHRFTLALSSTSDGFQARYWSTPKEMARPSSPHRPLSGTVTRDDASKALDAAMEHIDALDGPFWPWMKTSHPANKYTSC